MVSPNSGHAENGEVRSTVPIATKNNADFHVKETESMQNLNRPLENERPQFVAQKRRERENYFSPNNYDEDEYRSLQLPSYLESNLPEQETNENTSSKRDSLDLYAYDSTTAVSGGDVVASDANLFSHDNYENDFVSDILKSEKARAQ